MDNCLYTTRIDNLSVTTEVTARVVPFRSASFYEPSEGGYLEDVSFEVIEVNLLLDDEIVELTLTDKLKSTIVDILNRGIDAGGKIQEELYELMGSPSYHD